MKSWSLNAKIGLVVAIFVLSNIFAVGMGISKLSSLNTSLSNITGTVYKRIELLNEVNTRQLTLAIKVRDFAMSKDVAEQGKIEIDMLSEKEKMEARIKDFEEIAVEKGKVLAQKYLEQFAAWWSGFGEVKRLVREQKNDEAMALNKSKLVALRKAMNDTLNEIIDFNEKKMSDAAVDAQQEFERSRRDSILGGLLALVLGGVLCFFMIRAFNRMIKEIISSLSNSSVQVASTSRQIASASQELSQSTSEQAASLEETAASVEEMTSMIAKNTENAKKTAATSVQSQQTSSQGREAVEQMIQSMEKINQSNMAIMDQINESNQKMSEVVQVIQQIGSKTKVINDIVFQTKLLSFNASVEAARAGEHGKGFAVVAEEVGNLAQMSGNAAKEISGLLEESVRKVEGLVTETKVKVEGLAQQGKQEVADGVQVARRCGEVLGDVVSNTASVATMATEISSASQEQAQGISEINKAMSQLDQVTQQNAAAGEQAAKAAEDLSLQANVLRSAVEQLVSVIEGTKQASMHSTPVAKAARATRVAKEISTPENTPSSNHDGFKDVA